jgi:hypothetical protein
VVARRRIGDQSEVASERNPEAIAVTDNELSHLIVGVAERFEDWDQGADALVMVLQILRVDIEVNLAPGSGALAAALMNMTRLVPNVTMPKLRPSAPSPNVSSTWKPRRSYHSTVARTSGT